MRIPKITFYTEVGDEVTLNCIYKVCPRCEGKGMIVNPNIDGHGITDEEFRADPDFERDYFAGMYDIDCPECKRKRVVPEPCGTTNDVRSLYEYQQYLDEEANYEAMCRQERMMGC